MSNKASARSLRVSEDNWCVHLCMEPSRHRKFLIDSLHAVGAIVMEAAGASACGADLIVCDGSGFDQLQDAFCAQKSAATPLYLPVLFIASRGEGKPIRDSVWEVVDDVVRLPVRRRELKARLRRLLKMRQCSQKLRQSERRYQAFAEQTTDGLFIARRNGSSVEVNERACAMTGYSRSELLSMSPGDLIDKEDLAERPIPWEKDRVGEAWQYQRTMQRRDGSTFPAEVSVRPINGAFVQVIVRDVTEHHAAQRALRTSESKYRLLAENASDVIALFDPNLRFTYVSPAVERLLGYTPREAQTVALEELFTPASLKKLKEAFQRRKEAERMGWDASYKTRLELELVHKQGHTVWAESVTTALVDDEGRITNILTVARDITEQKARRRRLRESRRRLQALFDNALDTILLADDDGTYVDVNPAACQLIGYSREELIGMRVWDLTPGVDQRQGRAFWERFLEEGEQEGEYRAVANVVPGLHLSILRDVTERLRYEEELVHAKEEAEAMSRLKSVFLANMSHEIRTPLTSIIGFAELLRDELDGEPLEFVELIHESSKRLQETLSSVLDLARLESGSMTLHRERVDLAKQSEDVTAMFSEQARRKGLDLRFRPPAGRLFAEVDSVAFERILMNLVSNALKFTEEGYVEVRLTPRGNHVALTVEDTGVGIREAMLQKIFDEFKQESEGFGRSYEGTGLGLTITKRLLDLMGGAITVESVKGEGSTFTVTLPRWEV